MATNYCKNNHILIGLGGTGGKILKAFKMRMFEEFPNHEDRVKQPVALLYVDSTEEMMGIGRHDFRVMGLDASFTNNEFLYIKDVDVTKILDNINNYPAVKGIVNNVSAVKTAIGSLGQAAGQKRRAGRLLFAANAVGFVAALKDAYGRCDAVSHNAENTNIHIFAGLCGGTGSGAIIDAIVQSRKAFPEAIINVYAMIPEMNLPKANMDQGRYYQNGYAALNELNALQTGRFSPHDVTGAGQEARLFTDKVKGVANGITLYSNVNENGLTIDSLQELPKIVSDYVYSRIFLINSNDVVNEDIIRAYTFENMDDFALEYDETKNTDSSGQIPVARTKKINSFGIKRVMYPELRVLKHITYTIGESVLYQFKYNHWREDIGYVNEEENKDYRELYFTEKNLLAWMIDYKHLTLEKKILKSEKDFPAFNDYWHDKATLYTEEAKKADCPLNELDSILGDFFEKQFRGVGVVEYYKNKEHAIPELAKEVRRNIEHELFEKWKVGDISIIELQRVSRLLIEYISEKRKAIDEELLKEQDNYEAIDFDRKDNVNEWSQLGILQRMVNKGARLYADHQEILTDYYTCKTMLVAWEFAKKLAGKVFVEFGKLDADISAFGQKITDSIEETERLVTAQRKVNKGLEDMKGAIIEVCEEEMMTNFESDIRVDKIDMPNIARQLREAIIPKSEFTNFGNLANAITIDGVKDAFDLKLSEIVRIKHDEKADSDKKVLGLNILTQLQQKLISEEDIKRFALEIVNQSGVYLKLNNVQMQLHVRNNEGNLSPTNPASINKKTILVSIPSPDDNESLKAFADKLEKAFRDSFKQGTSQTSLIVNKKSSRKDELSIITIAYCFPMRCISWLTTYKEKYDNFLNTGNVNTDASNAILLHGEGNGNGLPSLFVVDVDNDSTNQSAQPKATSIPPMPSATPPPVIQEPHVQIYLAVSGQQYGPYDYATLKTFVPTGQLTEHTLVWQQGMVAWTPAGQVAELRGLFAPKLPDVPPVPPIPSTPNGMPPMP